MTNVPARAPVRPSIKEIRSWECSNNRDTTPPFEEKEIEITPEMIEAGLSEFREFCFGEDGRQIVEAVYLAMEIERRATYASSSALSVKLSK